MNERIDYHLDEVLRASGSSLRNYSMPTTLEAMRSAMAEAMAEGLPVYVPSEAGRKALGEGG